MRYGYGVDWIPGTAALGGVLLLLIVPPFALIAVALLAVAAVAALIALAGAILASPYLIVRSARRRLAERHETEAADAPAPSRLQPEPVAALASE
jgi:positive regulator of sigma E activity